MKGKAEGVKEGEMKGKAEGKAEEKLSIAKSMKTLGYTTEEIR